MSEPLGPIGDLISLLAEEGTGFTLCPVREGQPISGFGSKDAYQFNGWEVGYITPNGGGEIAVGNTIEEAVTVALEIERRRERP